MNAIQHFPRFRNNPAGLLFILSGILACASVFHWPLAAFSSDVPHRDVYHMITSVQAFLTCLIAAFYFSRLQDSDKSNSVHSLKFILVVLTASGTAITAWLRYLVPQEIMLGVSELCWLVLALTLAFSAFPGLSLMRKETPLNSSLVWIPIALIFGITGAVMVSTYSSVFVMTGNKIRWLVFLGRGYLLQCMFLAVIMAAAPVVLPRILASEKFNSQPLSKEMSSPVILAVLLALSIPLELWVSYASGMWMRALLAYFTVVHVCRLWHLPGRKSPLSWCIWISAWLIPAGYAVAALSPAYRLTGLHIVFIGGFTMGPLSFALSRMIDGDTVLKQRFDRVLPVGMYAALLILSLILRSMSDATDCTRIFSWGYSALTYIIGIMIWIYIMGGILISRRNTGPEPAG